ncbi:MAG: exodeoxyribonuclease VII large subunit [Clostridiales bacterium]|jgi:exodeoxyribonuclease VII large subunit|nr:exodeoxyribonuclease VII large subunit [Clostridiales bacterium]
MKRVVSVSLLTRYIKDLLDEDILLSGIFISGEISNFKDHSSGHLFFTLKDSSAEITAVMFSNDADTLTFRPKNGDSVVAAGAVSVYEKTGRYQLYIKRMEPVGKGTYALNFEKTKQELENLGIFSRKRPLPKFPKTIAVITSPDGAAVRDIINVSLRRFPAIKIIVVPALVQGAFAEESLVNGIGLANMTDADLIIIGRGGGSTEELDAFNGRNLAIAVFNSKIPVVSAVGHETDFTICDFAADVRAATPSAAAEIAIPEAEAILYSSVDTFTVIEREMFTRLEKCKSEIHSTENAILSSIRRKLQTSAQKLKNAADRLNALSPFAVLLRGYAVVDGKTDISQVYVGENVTVRMNGGYFTAKITEKGV